MSNEYDDEQFAQRLRQPLQQPLDEETRLELQQIRQNALRHARQQQTDKPRWLMPVAALATAAGVGALSVSLWLNQPDLNEQQAEMIADLEILGGEDELELYEEMDFLLWLEQQNETG